jgi:hypothetical protein
MELVFGEQPHQIFAQAILVRGDDR